jgi:hypothetical protein
MSFEGFYQFLCENGHYSVCDVDEYECIFWNENSIGKARCNKCDGNIVWENLVNTTNGSYECNHRGEEERIDSYIELEILEEAKYCTCHCGHKHIIEEARYKIPK